MALWEGLQYVWDRTVDLTADLLRGYVDAVDWVRGRLGDPTIMAGVISIAGNLGPALVVLGLATGNPALVAAGAVLVGANIGAFLAASEGNLRAARDGCISQLELWFREALMVAGLFQPTKIATVTDSVILGTDLAAPPRCTG